MTKDNQNEQEKKTKEDRVELPITRGGVKYRSKYRTASGKIVYDYSNKPVEKEKPEDDVLPKLKNLTFNVGNKGHKMKIIEHNPETNSMLIEYTHKDGKKYRISVSKYEFKRLLKKKNLQFDKD